MTPFFIEFTLVLLFLIIYSDGQICRKENVALNKPTNQSSTSHNGNSNRAVDGNNATDFSRMSCTHTVEGRYPHWWEVDLEDVYNISDVTITNRGHTTTYSRLKNFDIEIGNTSNNFELCHYQNGTLGRGQTLSFPCGNSGQVGRYVKITLHNHDEPLTLCEVQVNRETCYTGTTNGSVDSIIHTANTTGTYNNSLAETTTELVDRIETTTESVDASNGTTHVNGSLGTSNSTSNTTGCNCSCTNNNVSDNIPKTTKELLEKVETLKRELKVGKKETNAHKRTLISAPDERPSSMYIGYFGIVAIVIPFVIVVAMDIFSGILWWNTTRN